MTRNFAGKWGCCRAAALRQPYNATALQRNATALQLSCTHPRRGSISVAMRSPRPSNPRMGIHRKRPSATPRGVVGGAESLYQQSQNRFRGDRHLGNGAETGAHVLQTGPEEMDLVVDDQETVVVFMRQLDEPDFGVLGVVFLQVGEKLLVVTGVDRGRNAVGTLGEH